MLPEIEKCKHNPDDGCMWCCEECDTDTHRCGGWGSPVTHLMKGICRDCMIDHIEDQVPYYGR